MEFNLALKSSREPASRTEDGPRCYKIRHQLIAIGPANYYTAGDSRTRGNHRLRQIRAEKDTYQHSFFPRSIREWNRVPSSVVDAGSLEDFKVRLNSISWASSQHR
jgi:hypothetical protein